MVFSQPKSFTHMLLAPKELTCKVPVFPPRLEVLLPASLTGRQRCERLVTDSKSFVFYPLGILQLIKDRLPAHGSLARMPVDEWVRRLHTIPHQ